RRIGDLTLIVDCYNANPQSVRASLDVLEAQGMAARKVAVLGSMLELGDASRELHVAVLADALLRDIDLVAATGLFAEAAEDALARVAAESTAGATPYAPAAPPFASRLVVGADWSEAYPDVRDHLYGNEVVLLKASRGVALEGILPLLEADFGGPVATEDDTGTGGQG
ncbi:MAG: cyanophycin synthetase, partial [Longimicrobiales bacterium]|nr:cyanophycin synthetase [Longimicrobiales bacterium]